MTSICLRPARHAKHVRGAPCLATRIVSDQPSLRLAGIPEKTTKFTPPAHFGAGADRVASVKFVTPERVYLTGSVANGGCLQISPGTSSAVAGEIRRHPPFATLPVRYTRSDETNFTDATRSAPAPKCAGGVNFEVFSGIPASGREGWSETSRVVKHGAPRTCFARRAGLRHMLVILNIRHEDSLFSKINKFASLTSVDARKNGENKRCEAPRPCSRQTAGNPQAYACHFKHSS